MAMRGEPWRVMSDMLWSWCANKTQRPTRRRLLQRSRLDDRRSAAGKYTGRRPSCGRLFSWSSTATTTPRASSRYASPAVCYQASSEYLAQNSMTRLT